MKRRYRDQLAENYLIGMRERDRRTERNIDTLLLATAAIVIPTALGLVLGALWRLFH